MTTPSAAQRHLLETLRNRPQSSRFLHASSLSAVVRAGWVISREKHGGTIFGLTSAGRRVLQPAAPSASTEDTSLDLISLLADQPPRARLTVAEISEKLELSASQLLVAISELERDGLILSDFHDADRSRRVFWLKRQRSRPDLPEVETASIPPPPPVPQPQRPDRVPVSAGEPTRAAIRPAEVLQSEPPRSDFRPLRDDLPLDRWAGPARRSQRVVSFGDDPAPGRSALDQGCRPGGGLLPDPGR